MSKDYEGKGIDGEEAIRNYFLETGHFAVRGVPFRYKSFDVTDVDLWLYVKSTSLSRERSCVDIKRRKTPQAMERVFWTKGLREALGVERAIVVTTDKRSETRDFGAVNGVTVLLGDFVQGAISGYNRTGRLSEEELQDLIKGQSVVDRSVFWPRWYQNTKAKLIGGLDFSTCNNFLVSIHLLLQEFVSTGKNTPAVRLLYLLISYFLITLDFTTRSFAQMETSERTTILIEGLRYGEAGKERTEEVIDTALNLLASSGKADLFTKTNIKKEFQEQLEFFPAEILGEYFSKSEALRQLFDLAREFESNAYAPNLVMPSECRSEHKAIIGLLCDFWGMDRKTVL